MMTFLFILGLILICIFSFSSACYFVYFKLGLGNRAVKAGLTVVVGVLFFALTFAVSIILIWPPYLWSILE